MAENMNRRRFFTTVVKLTGAAVVAPAVLNTIFADQALAQKKRGAAPAAAGGGAGTDLLSPTDSVATAVQYAEDYKKVPKAGANHCGNCGLYDKKEIRGGKEVGTCRIFPGKVVKFEAWCASWNKKV